MSNFTLQVVYPDGNPRDVESFGEDLGKAVVEMEKRQADATPGYATLDVYDAEDTERGYFEREDLELLEAEAKA